MADQEPAELGTDEEKTARVYEAFPGFPGGVLTEMRGRSNASLLEAQLRAQKAIHAADVAQSIAAQWKSIVDAIAKAQSEVATDA